MKTPARKRPRPQALSAGTDPRELEEWASTVRYIGSAEHKTYPSFAGSPKLRSDATPCPRELNDAKEIESWLRQAISLGQVSAYRDQDTYPRYVWSKHHDQWYEARLVNAVAGDYKGYPVTEESIPPELLKREL